ncbi:MAG: hypothetical protein K2Q01_10990, partial [Rickettsiales bacterium]|nr:hypothetical protein [Rickettsiales bacterium]
MTATIDKSNPLNNPVDTPEETKAARTSTSRGEKMFDLLTYGGIAGVGTFALTIPLAYWAKYGAGAKHFENASKFLVRQGLSKPIAEEMVMTSALMQGGNVGIIPVKIMENYKPTIVGQLNDWMGDKSGAASVKEDPQQTWGSLIKSRLVAWLAVFTGFRATASLLGGDKLAQFEKDFAKHVVCEPLGKPTH